MARLLYRLFFLVFLINLNIKAVKSNQKAVSFDSYVGLHIYTTFDFFCMDPTLFPDYTFLNPIDQIILDFTREELKDPDYPKIFIQKMIEQLKVKVRFCMEFAFKYQFASMSEEILTKLIFCQRITTEEFTANSSFIEIAYKCYIIKKAIYELEKLQSLSVTEIDEFQWTIETYFGQTEIPEQNIIRFSLRSPPNSRIPLLLLTDIFSHPAHPATYNKNPTIFNQAEFSLFLRAQLNRRLSHLRKQPINPENRFGNCRQFSMLINLKQFIKITAPTSYLVYKAPSDP